MHLDPSIKFLEFATIKEMHIEFDAWGKNVLIMLQTSLHKRGACLRVLIRGAGFHLLLPLATQPPFSSAAVLFRLLKRRKLVLEASGGCIGLWC